MLVLGIDTSCDDTSLALLRDGKTLLSNVVSSQVDLHRVFGGVVPEIASRRHIELIEGLYRETLRQGDISGSSIDAIGVTAGPGLIGSVLVGLCFAKGLALSLGKPLIAVNHIEAHAMSIFLEKEVAFPFIALVVSGGHTIMLLIEGFGKYRALGSTRDDAAGEAFDKIAKYLGIGYPGGKVIEDLSAKGKGDYVAFPRPMADEKNYDFSYSGLKTAMINYIKKYGVTDYDLSDIMASFQEAAFDVLTNKTIRAARDLEISRIVVGGGVASNGRLRQLFAERCREEGMEALFSSPEFCTDNGAMVARVAYQYYSEGTISPLNVAGYSRMKIH
ncbi:MAG: tRNA N6-adenosine threonylcarbamoyltransferase [Syntrophorhabdus sp. PtaU1.Bin153]|nr:MAG: tRNA N6-adenosine threonylcarbamoyltransferase [Syntrophorhabdus sp. PtaU1.Bin153]